jgi:hypothetical protein
MRLFFHCLPALGRREVEDKELEAMQTVYEALQSLDEGARQRTLNWATDRLGLSVAPKEQTADQATRSEGSEFADLAELIDVAQPTKGPDYAQVVAYWLQVVNEKDGWSGNEINSELRNMGHGVANIATTLDRLIKRRPSLVMQTARAGKGTTAKKTYKLTTAGVKGVEKMVSSPEKTAGA